MSQSAENSNISRFKQCLDKIPLDELGKQGLAESSRAPLNGNTSILESRDLGVGTSLTTADDGTSVAHTAARWSTDTSDEADGRLVVLVVLLEELGGILLSAATNLTNHDDTIGLLVLKEDTQAVDEVGAREGVTANTNDEGLAKTSLGGLVHSLIGQGAGTGNDTNTATLVDESRHDTDLALTLYHMHVSSIDNIKRYRKTRLTGAMIPGQLGPTKRVLFWVLSISVMRTMSDMVSSRVE